MLYSLRLCCCAMKRSLPIAHRGLRLPVPVEIRAHIGAALAADPTGEALLDIGQSGIIGPRITADRDYSSSGCSSA
jgi:hypothetical protein